MYDNSENLKICTMASFFCRQEPNPCCRYKSFNTENRCGNYGCFYWNENYWSWSKPGLARYAFALLIQFVIKFLVLILIEIGFFRKLKYTFNSEKIKKIILDNKQEKETEKLIKDNQKNLIVKNLTKCYTDLTAVNNLSFDVKQNECFGLLGKLFEFKYFLY